MAPLFAGRERFVGGIAQLGERLHGMQEVSGSIPLISTKKPFWVKEKNRIFANLSFKLVRFLSIILTSMSPSSRGLGHLPFTEATGVRIPVGTPQKKKPLSNDSGFFIAKNSKNYVNSSFNPAINKTKAKTFLIAFAE
ncbi:MAG: hypothetical protein RLZZ98_180 [Pseudomonadota bacterium]